MADKRNRWKNLYSKNLFFQCPYCMRILSMKEATKEFEPPISRQRELGPSRIIPACKECNSEKGALSAEEYKRWLTEKNYIEWCKLEDIRVGNRGK